MQTRIEKIDPEKALLYLDTCLNLQAKAFEKDLLYSKSHLQKVLNSKDLYLAWYQGEIVGYANAKKFKDGRYHISTLAIDPKYHHQHIGTTLMKEIEEQNKELSISLECRPYNEPFYKKLGFKAVCLPKKKHLNDDYYHLNYYSYAGLSVHGIFMKKMPTTTINIVRSSDKKRWVSPDDKENYETYRSQLQKLATLTKSATSVAYGGWLATLFRRSKRKEKALNAIINELNALSSEATKNRVFNPISVLQAISHNALIIRGFGLFSKKTTSGRAVLKLLNKKEFQPLRKLISDSDTPLTYQELKDFSQMKKNEKSKATKRPYSPYWHF